MTEKATQLVDNQEQLIENFEAEQAFFQTSAFQAAMLLIVGLTILGSLYVMPLSFTIAYALLIGAWGVDVALKVNFGFGRKTAIADLAFAAFAFSVSYAVGHIAFGLSEITSFSLVESFIIAGVAGVFWLASLIASKGTNNEGDQQREITAKTFALGVSIFSTILALGIALLPHMVITS